jgi:hypothetical protein
MDDTANTTTDLFPRTVTEDALALYQNGTVSHILARGDHFVVYDIDCQVCEQSTHIIVKSGDVSPACCPLCGNDCRDENEFEDDDEYDEDEDF